MFSVQFLFTIFHRRPNCNRRRIQRTRSKVWRLQGIYAISSKFGEFPVNIRVVVAREAYKETWLQGPSAVVALPAACIVNTGLYRGTTL
jgi:hypothetical protein